MGKKVRILADQNIEGVPYKGDQVVDLPAAVAKQLSADGQVDPHPDAVAYCINALGQEVIAHEKQDSAEVVRVKEDILQLEERLKTASDEEKPVIEDQIAANKAFIENA